MQRRALWKAMAAAVAGSTVANGNIIAAAPRAPRGARHYFVASQGTSLYFKDWATGRAPSPFGLDACLMKLSARSKPADWIENKSSTVSNTAG
jgi:hypothetical protein